MNAKRWLVVLAGVTVLVGCSFVVTQAAPQKTPSSTRTDAAQKADALFWSTLHGGHYDEIAQALDALTAAYIANPGDALTAARIGWMHMWRLSESTRFERAPATISDDAALPRKYLEDANRTHPTEPRHIGFVAGSTMAEGSIHKDDRLVRRGYFTLMDSIDAWPEFNLFTGGYVLSRRPPDSSFFRQALDWQWQTLDLCVGEKVDRRNLDYA